MRSLLVGGGVVDDDSFIHHSFKRHLKCLGSWFLVHVSWFLRLVRVDYQSDSTV